MKPIKINKKQYKNNVKNITKIIQNNKIIGKSWKSRKRKSVFRWSKPLKNKAFLPIIGKIGKIPGYIYTYRRGMGGDACSGEVGGRMHHVYIY